ncbi:MAG TPA: hypothetical protein VGC20_08585 [bacterium]
MFLLALHIVAVGLLVMLVWSVAFNRGQRAGERQLRRRLSLDAQQDPGTPPSASGEQG